MLMAISDFHRKQITENCPIRIEYPSAFYLPYLYDRLWLDIMITTKYVGLNDKVVRCPLYPFFRYNPRFFSPEIFLELSKKTYFFKNPTLKFIKGVAYKGSCFPL